jgi:hypothetical protein
MSLAQLVVSLGKGGAGNVSYYINNINNSTAQKNTKIFWDMTPCSSIDT